MSATGTERAPWLCCTCVWGSPESLGYSCSRLEGHICSHVIVACEEYRRRHELAPMFIAHLCEEGVDDGDE